MHISTLPALPSIATGRYRHYKGGLYELLGTVRHSETLEPMVLYRACVGAPALWVRPFAMWGETVWFEGRQVARFTPLADQPPGR